MMPRRLGGTLREPWDSLKRGGVGRRAGQARRPEGFRPADVGEEEGASWGRSGERKWPVRGPSICLSPSRDVRHTSTAHPRLWIRVACERWCGQPHLRPHYACAVSITEDAPRAGGVPASPPRRSRLVVAGRGRRADPRARRAATLAGLVGRLAGDADHQLPRARRPGGHRGSTSATPTWRSTAAATRGRGPPHRPLRVRRTRRRAPLGRRTAR